MKKLTAAHYIFFLFLAFLGYFVLYFGINKPLTLGEIDRLYNQKVALTKSGEGSRIFIFAGSNGRFSHSCAVISKDLDRYCGNLSIAAGVGLDFMLASYEQNFRRGDVIYMPMEFQQYMVSKDAMYSGPENPILFKKNFSLLWSLGIERTIHAAFFANENYFIQGAAEMLLQRKGVQRRFTEASVNAYGDQQGHTSQLAAEYSTFLNSVHEDIPNLTLAANSYANQILKEFLVRAKTNGVIVVGGLPTTFSGTKLPPATLLFLKKTYEDAGQKFLVLDNNSQYEKRYFFDKPYHLNEVYQSVHSHKIAKMLMNVGGK